MGEIAALSASAVWAMASIIFARLGKTVSALALNWLKCVIALALMFLTLYLLEGRFWPEALTSWQLAILAMSGLVGLTIGDTAFFQALNRLGPRRTLLLSALSPPMTMLLAVPVLGEEISLSLLLGMILTMGGVIWVIRERHGGPESAEGPTDGGPDALKRIKQGIAFGILAALCQASGNVLTKLGGAEISALEISIVRLVAGIVGLTFILGVTKNLVATMLPMRDRRLATMIIVATFLGTFLGIWLMNAGLRYTDASIASTLSSTSPIFVLPLAYFIDREKLSWRSVLGAFIAVIGVAILFFF